jgi:hypothetical protein
MPSRRQLGLVVACTLLAALPASAEIYTVMLKSGNSFDSRYPPRVAAYDANKVLVFTEWGNWMAVDRNDVSEVTTQTATMGYGTVLDTTTISLGTMANDKAEEGQGAPPTPAADKPYSIDQFVEPGKTQGLPLSYTGGSSSSPVAQPTPPPTPPPSSPAASDGGGGTGQ